MPDLEKPIESLTAADLMSCALVTIPEEMSQRDAAKLLAERDVRGAPVVDENGRCIGVVSTTDFLRATFVETMESPLAAEADFCCPWQVFDHEKLSGCVKDIANKCPKTVSPNTPIGDLAQMMVASHIHRLIVVEDAGALVGIVSGTDLLGALATLAKKPDLARAS